MTPKNCDPIITIKGLRNAFGDAVIHDDLDLTVCRGEILGVVGGSGTGKSVLLRSIIGLQTPEQGSVEVLGENMIDRSEDEAKNIRRRWGILFQNGALFSTLTVAENVEVPIREYFPFLVPPLLDEIASYKIAMGGLPPDAGPKFPSELSGGMIKRAGLARALALDPELLFLDEPTAGLDPIAAAAFDQLILSLQKRLGLTVFLITHDLDTLHAICDRVAVLAEKRVIGVGTIPELLALDHPWIQEYFNGPRGRNAAASYEHEGAVAWMETRSNYVMVGAVTMALLVGVLLFIVWLAGLSNKTTKCYDIYFGQAVGGLNKGSNVTFSGVPVGQVKKISLLPSRPEFVWVRIDVDEQTPVLQGTTAQLKGVGFTGVSEIQLDGAVRGSPPITQIGPQGCAVVPATSGGLGALLNSAPELIDHIQRLTERLTELLGDKNQNAIADILDNVDATTRVLAAHSPELAATISDMRVTVRNAGVAAQRIAALSDSTNRLVNEQGRPAAEDLRKSIAGVQKATDNLDAMISDARPGIQNFSKSTLPEANRLVRDMRDLTQSLKGVSQRVEQGGIGGALGPEKLPDYKPRKK